jgi:hypothetical protein
MRKDIDYGIKKTGYFEKIDNYIATSFRDFLIVDIQASR